MSAPCGTSSDNTTYAAHRTTTRKAHSPLYYCVAQKPAHYGDLGIRASLWPVPKLPFHYLRGYQICPHCDAKLFTWACGHCEAGFVTHDDTSPGMCCGVQVEPVEAKIQKSGVWSAFTSFASGFVANHEPMPVDEFD